MKQIYRYDSIEVINLYLYRVITCSFVL